MNVATATKQELQEEINRLQKELKEREEAERKEAEKKFYERMELLREGGTKWVDALVPEHTRTSCNDQCLSNGFHSSEHGPRCTRCALLEIIVENTYPSPDVVFEISVRGN